MRSDIEKVTDQLKINLKYTIVYEYFGLTCTKRIVLKGVKLETWGLVLFVRPFRERWIKEIEAGETFMIYEGWEIPRIPLIHYERGKLV